MDALRFLLHAVEHLERHYSHVCVAFLEIDITYQCCLLLLAQDARLFYRLLTIAIALECLILHLLMRNLLLTDRPR